MGQEAEYPVTPKTLNKYADQIYNSAKLGVSSSIIFDDIAGGARAWIKFLIDPESPSDFYSKLSKEGLIVAVEPYESLENSKIGFFYNLLESIDTNSKHPSIEEYSLNQLIDDINSRLDKLLENNPRIFIFYIGIGKFENFDQSYGNLLYSMWKKHLGKIVYIASFKEKHYQEFIKNRAGQFSKALNEKIINVEPLERDDISHIISHWEDRLATTFSIEVKEIIEKYSNKSAPIIKAICQMIAAENNQDIPSLELIIQKYVSDQHAELAQYYPIKTKNRKYFIDITELNSELTHAELEIFHVLFAYKGSLVNKKQIAKALWEEQEYEKYSDWAIDKHISSIRKTLRKLNAKETIKSIKGKGYLLENT